MSTDQDKHANKDIKGAFKRSATEFHDKITATDSKYTAEKGRYHLYYSGACPWCHRVLLMIALKGLDDVISSSNLSPLVSGYGTATYVSWRFDKEYPDPLHKHTKNIWDIYKIHDKDYPNQKLTVPIIFDKKTNTIVNNESAEIIVFLNTEFNTFATNPELDLNPDDEKIQALMQQWNDAIYPNLNDGVYRCGFARTQQAYMHSYNKIFDTLDKMEKQLTKNRYLCGNQLTLTDIRAWPTLIRFDGVYFTHFKCNLKMIQYSYPNIWAYTREIYQMKHVAQTFDLQHSKLHYYGSHKTCNPHGLIPQGPAINFNMPHDRDHQQYETQYERCDTKENEKVDKVEKKLERLETLIQSFKMLQKQLPNLLEININKYENWDLNNIMFWIKCLENGRFKKYEEQLMVAFTESGISSKELPNLNTSDLSTAPFNIKVFSDKRDLIAHFKNLRKND